MTSTIKKSLSSFLAVCMLFGLFFVLDQPITANAAEALSNVSTISTTSVQKGQSVQVNAIAKGGTGFYQYAAYSKLSSATAWTTEQGYGANSIIMVAFDSAGSYDVRVAVKDSNGEVATKDFVVSVGSSSLTNNSTLSATSIALGDSVKVNAKASGGTAPYLYGVYYKKTSSDKWSTAQAYKSNSTISFKPGAATTYDVKVKVKDGAGKIVAKSFKITVTKALSNTSSVSSALISLGQNVTVTCGATGGKTPYLFGVYYKLTTVENFSTLQAYNSNKAVTFTPKKSGTYDIKIKVKDASNKIISKSFQLTVTGSAALTNTSNISTSNLALGDTLSVSASASRGKSPYQYAVYYRSTDTTTWKTVQNYSNNTLITIKPTIAGEYEVCIKAKDSAGTIAKKYITFTAKSVLTNTSSISSEKIKPGESVTIRGSAKGGTGFYQYAFYYKKSADSSWITKQSYSTTTTAKLELSEEGAYDIYVKVKDSDGTIAKKTMKLTVAEEHSGTKYDITYYVDLNDSYLQKLNIVNDNPNYYYSGENLELQDLIVEGYRFDGWFTKQSGGTLVETIPAGTTGKKTLYAHWTKEPYTITFDSSLVPYNDTNSLTRFVSDTTPLRDLKWDGYVFIGWSDDDGNIIKSVKPGATDITVHANWMSERNKAWAKKDIGKPIIIESEETNSILFVYEIGRIDNVPLQVIEDFGYINSEGVTKTVSKEYSVKTDINLMKQYTQTVSNSTTNTAQWSLSNDWTDSVTVSENYLKENNLSETDAKTLCTTDNQNWLVSSGAAGATTMTTYDSAQEYDLNTSTGNTKTYDTQDESGSKTHKQSAELNLSAKEYLQVSGGANMGAGHIEGKTGVEFNQELGLGYEGSHTNSSASKTGTETDEGNQTQTGPIKHTGTDTVSTGSWNNSSSYGGSKTISNTDSVSKTVSEKIASEYGYGKTYIKHGGETNTQGTSTSLSNSNAYSSAVTYSTEETTKETITYTTSNTKTGYHRLIKAGTAHVFAMVGYDIKTASYFVTTYTVMDDESHDFEDYSYSTSRYDDNQISVIPFEIPHEVEEYVLSMVGESEGLEFNKAGKVTGYNGTEKTVIIPEYHVFDNQDGTKSVVKVTSIGENAFKNNKQITGIQLSDYISEIPANAFEGCTSLSLIDMANVTSIGAEAFKNCGGFDTVFLSQKVESIGKNAFENLKTFSVYTKKKNVVEGAINSGAKNIIIYADNPCNELNGSKLQVPNETEIFIFHGCGNTFSNLTITSDAAATVINNVTLNTDSGIPLKTSSSEVQLGQVTIDSSSIAMILTNENCALILYGESSLTSKMDDALLCRNAKVMKTYKATEQGVFTELEVNSNVLILGSLTNSSLINYSGSIKEISEDEFAKYSNGVYTISFNANSGTVSSASKQVYFGQNYGTLPSAQRDYYDFAGWYTAASGGTRIYDSTVFTGSSDITLYAHWEQKPLLGWTLASNVPSNAKIEERKWTYTLREYTENSSSSLNGWTQYERRRTGWGGTQGPVYYDPSNGERNVWSESYVISSNYKTVYHYYRYSNSYTGGKGSYTNYYPNYYQYDFDWELEETSSIDGHRRFMYWYCDTNWTGVYMCDPYTTQEWVSDNYGTRWYFQDPIYTYYYYRDVNKESGANPSGSNISNVQEWVKYRAK